ncbi:MAG: hypothetical protein HZB99_02740 [Candidatus Harrisonbacteria bacterium]|nr:hypothetical protein [Candidatus Harrisonbacteria bacterium]
MLVFGMFLFIVFPVVAVTIYVTIYFRKKDKLEELFKIITTETSLKKIIDSADEAIIILHRNKVLFLPEPIAINITKPKEDLLAFHLFKAEIKYLFNEIDRVRGQKTYLSSLEPRERSQVLKFLNQRRAFLENIDYRPFDLETKGLLLFKVYRDTVNLFLDLPDENQHQEFNYFPLFEIVDRRPNRTIVLLPYFPARYLPA